MDNKRPIDKFNLKEVICLLVIVCLVSLVTGFAVANRSLKDKYTGTNSKTNSNLQTFIENYNYIIDNYYGEIDENKLLDSALAGVLEALGDPHTAYIDQNDVDNFNIRLDGEYEGVGIEVSTDKDNNVMIFGVIENSPAEKVGLKTGDIIMEIAGDKVLNSQEFAKKIKEMGNEEFSVIVERNGKELKFMITRDTIYLNSVTDKVFERENRKIGYLGISIFANNTYSQLKQKLSDLEYQGIDSLVIDVRGNTGGHLTSVENILGLFLDDSHIIYRIEDEKGVESVYSSGTKTATYPIVVLTNELSASASEILTAALKEECNAKSVGQKTYGKGSAQELRTLPDGTQYKITTKKWLTPSGASIDGVGIDVDMNIKFDAKYYDNPVDENDNQLQSAINLILGK